MTEDVSTLIKQSDLIAIQLATIIGGKVYSQDLI